MNCGYLLKVSVTCLIQTLKQTQATCSCYLTVFFVSGLQ